MKTARDLLDQKATLLAYLNMQVKRQDWHGVADAACDLRVIETELRVYEELRNGNFQAN